MKKLIKKIERLLSYSGTTKMRSTTDKNLKKFLITLGNGLNLTQVIMNFLEYKKAAEELESLIYKNHKTSAIMAHICLDTLYQIKKSENC